MLIQIYKSSNQELFKDLFNSSSWNGESPCVLDNMDRGCTFADACKLSRIKKKKVCSQTLAYACKNVCCCC